jgi:hypothetical protein
MLPQYEPCHEEPRKRNSEQAIAADGVVETIKSCLKCSRSLLGHRAERWQNAMAPLHYIQRTVPFRISALLTISLPRT